MNEWKIWFLSLCLFSILTSVMLNILPETNTKKYFGYGLSVIFIFLLTKPIFNNDICFTENFDIINNFSFEQGEINNNVRGITADYLEQLIYEEFKIESDCNVRCEYNEDIMNIVEIEIIVSEEEMQQRIFDYIYNLTGVKPDIRVKEVGNEN